MSQRSETTAVAESPEHMHHREWCFMDGECHSDQESVIHQSVSSSVVAVNNNNPATQLDVSTHQFFGLDNTGAVTEATPAPQVWLRQYKTDGVDLTITEARQLAQALTNHADLAAGAAADPIDRAATLITSMLGHTGRDVHQLHDALVRWIDVMVDAMASAR